MPPSPRKPSVARASARSRPASLGTPPDAQSAAAQVMHVLPAAMDAMRLAMRAQLDGPLTVPQFRCLNFVERHPGSTVSAVAGFLGVTLATASAMVDRLVKAGHLRARASLADRRCTELLVGTSGRVVLQRMHRQTCDDLARTLGARTPQELQALVDGLQVLQATFAHVESETP